MRKILIIIMTGLALTLALSLFAGEHKACQSSADDCLKKIQTKLENVGWLGIETEKGVWGGAAITAVVEGSPAQAAGFLVGDVIVAINGVELGNKNKEVMKKVEFSMAPDTQVTYTVKRGANRLDLVARLAKMPDKVMAQIIGEHMLKGHMQPADQK